MDIKITKSRALQIQADQVDHYVRHYGERVREIVAAATHADQLDGEGPHNAVTVNRAIPRGGDIRGSD